MKYWEKIFCEKLTLPDLFRLLNEKSFDLWQRFFDSLVETTFYASSGRFWKKCVRKKRNFMDLYFWAKLPPHLREKMVRKKTQICSLRVHRNSLRWSFVSEKYMFSYQNRTASEKYSKVWRSFSAGLSKVHFSCPEEECEDKQFRRKKNMQSLWYAEDEPGTFRFLAKRFWQGFKTGFHVSQRKLWGKINLWESLAFLHFLNLVRSFGTYGKKFVRGSRNCFFRVLRHIWE